MGLIPKLFIYRQRYFDHKSFSRKNIIDFSLELILLSACHFAACTKTTLSFISLATIFSKKNTISLKPKRVLNIFKKLLFLSFSSLISKHISLKSSHIFINLHPPFLSLISPRMKSAGNGSAFNMPSVENSFTNFLIIGEALK